jgi:hypothetical protein
MRASVRLTVFLNENGYGLTEQKNRENGILVVQLLKKTFIMLNKSFLLSIILG